MMVKDETPHCSRYNVRCIEGYAAEYWRGHDDGCKYGRQQGYEEGRAERMTTRLTWLNFITFCAGIPVGMLAWVFI